jgi:RNA polymerase sigma-70 factor (ECF subfamily)
VYDEQAAELLPDPGALPDTNHDVKLLNELLSKLPDKQREAIVLFELSGFSIEEIRDLQGGSLSGVKMRLSRGRDQLRLWLEEPSEGTIEGSRHKAQGASGDNINSLGLQSRKGEGRK